MRYVTKNTVIVIEVMALIIGTAEAFFTGLRAALAPGTSLALAINAAQERIFNAIDGNCSVDEILREVAGEVSDEQACRFIEQLWEYDHIVFDATGSH